MSNIEEKVVKREVTFYEVAGNKFSIRQEAEDTLFILDNLMGKEFYIVSCNPDLSRGAGYQSQILIAINPKLGKMGVYEYLHGLLGRQTKELENGFKMASYVLNEVGILNEIKEISKVKNETYSNTSQLRENPMFPEKSKRELFIVPEANNLLSPFEAGVRQKDISFPETIKKILT